MTVKRIWTRLALLLTVALMMMVVIGTVSAQTDDEKANALIAIVANSEPFESWLANYPNYQVNASGPDDNGVWYIEFYDEPWEEWLGYANFNENTLAIEESFAPVPLAPDVEQAQRDLLLPFVLNDIEVLAWLNNTPDLWDEYSEFNRWDQVWEVTFYRGIQAVKVTATVEMESESIYLQSISDPNILDEEDQLDDQRDSAVSLAYGGDGIDDALNGYDEWTTYVEWQYDEVWSVSFVTEDKTLYYALVDLSDDTILEGYASD